MRYKFATALSMALICATLAMAQQPPTVTAQPNMIYVSAEGRYEAPPDTAMVQFNIGAQEDKARAAYDRASRAAEQIREILRSNNIDPKAAEIGFLSVAPVYDWRDPKHKTLAYRVSSSVRLKLKDFSKIAPIVQQLADIDVTENQTLSYVLDNMDAAKIHAVQDAYQRAHGEAAALATAGGRSLGELSYSSVDTYEQVHVLAAPRAMMARAGAAAADVPPPTAEFTPQTIVVTARVNAMFAMK